MTWWVISTSAGLWIEQSVYEPQDAVAGPYSSHSEAIQKLYTLEQIDSRNGKALGWIGLGWVLLALAGVAWWGIWG